MKSVTVFGREPAAVVGFLESLLTLLLAFGLLGWAGVNDKETLGVVMAVVTTGAGVYVAYVTHDTMLGYVVAFTKAAVALLAVYHLDLTLEQSAALIAAVTLAMGFFQRTQTSPAPEGERTFSPAT